jgi:hypothetical protein
MDISKGGPRVLFLGVETQWWNTDQFSSAGAWAKAQGFTGIAIKVAEGTILWYGGYDSIAANIDAMKAHGIGVLPYVYGYPQYLNGEIPIYRELMRRFGCVVLDLEAEFNGQVGAAQALCNGMKGAPGSLYVTTWADPAEQNWHSVLSALVPCTAGWIPQAYTNWLEGAMNREYGNDNIMPAVSMTSDFGANDPLAIARDAQSRGHGTIFIWEYATAMANTGLLSRIVAAFPGQNGGSIVQQFSKNSRDFRQFGFSEDASGMWHQGGFVIGHAMKTLYASVSVDGQALPVPGLPKSNEKYVSFTSSEGKSGVVSLQYCERGCMAYNVSGEPFDSQSGFNSAYFAHQDHPLVIQNAPWYQPEAPGPVVEKIPQVVVDDLKSLDIAFTKLIADARLS